jgi:hypothetical protein
MRKSKGKSRAKQTNNSGALSSKQKSEFRKLKERGLIAVTGKENPTTLKRKVSSAAKKYETEIDDTKTFFWKLPKNKQGEAIREKAEQIGLVTTPKGFFYERGFRSGSQGELKVTKTGKASLIIKEPKTDKSRARTIIIPIETLDDLARKKDRLRQEAEKLGPLKKGEHLTFRVTEKNREGLSKHHFRTADQIFNWIDQYEKSRSRHLDTPAKKNLWKNYFYRHVDIIKTGNAEHNQALSKIRETREKRHKQYLKQRAQKRKNKR